MQGGNNNHGTMGVCVCVHMVELLSTEGRSKDQETEVVGGTGVDEARGEAEEKVQSVTFGDGGGGRGCLTLQIGC